MMDIQKCNNDNNDSVSKRDKSFPDFEDLSGNTTDQQLLQEENRMEADLEYKQPAGDGGPEDDE